MSHPRLSTPNPLLNVTDPITLGRRQLLLGLLGVGLCACALAYVTQLPRVDPLDSVALPVLFLALLVALVGVLSRRMDADQGARTAYVILAAYMLLSLNYQLIFISPQTHGLSEATYWFAVVYCTAFMARSGADASRLAGLTFVLSLVSGLVDLTYLNGHGGVHPRLYGFLGQFYASGLACILLLAHITSLRERYGEVRRASQQDGLTGLNNRGHGEGLLQLACTAPQTLALILFDLDHFKQVNDRHGHAAGDQALRAAALTALQHLPPGAHAVRWGGEEFLLIVPGVSHGQAHHLAELVRSQIATLHSHGHVERVTASFGVVMRRPGESAGALLGRADAALYHAKDGGRDQVYSESAEEPV